ncbi:MAG TPA: prepilin peptidase [Terracidiphilus sp.]|jgi:leader peptidase (prepilin peptidase)/N-methyltransferase|nr:prepilin peptidase [Terracidiphilus sp.]
MFRIVGTLFSGRVGLAFGSFLNVCLTRSPAGESVVKPRSHCRDCGHTLAWWENVPVLSWIALRGRCRRCGGWIGWRYPIVELAVASIWATIAWQAIGQLNDALTIPGSEGAISFSPMALAQVCATLGGMLLLTLVLVGLAALDAEHLWLPDSVTLPGIVLGIVVTVVRGEPLVTTGQFNPSLVYLLLNLAFAILIAGGSILLIHWLYWLIRRREGIGLGDAKLMAMLAAWLGLPGTLLAFVLGVLIGALIGLSLLLRPRTRQDTEAPGLLKLPLGTFLCIGGIVSALWGSQIISLYLVWAGF